MYQIGDKVEAYVLAGLNKRIIIGEITDMSDYYVEINHNYIIHRNCIKCKVGR